MMKLRLDDHQGFGGTDAPKVPPESMAFYSYKRAANDVKELARQLGVDKVILGGHDWGGAVVYRIALWYPDFVLKVFSVCTPFWAPSSTFVPLEEIVKSKWPNFRYQLHLASGEVEKHIQSKESIQQFLNACYGGKGPNGEFGIDVTGTTKFEDLHKLGKTPVITAAMLGYYAEQYARNGMHGTLNWYRTREQNHRDELRLNRKTIDVPCLFIQATKDKALPPVMSEGMERYIPNLTRKSIETGHWALWEAPDRVNMMIREWLLDSGTDADTPKSHL